MRQKVHVLNRLTGQIETAILTTEHPASGCGQLVIVLENGQNVHSSQYEVLPFPLADELGVAPREDNGRAH
ncbi:MAG: hypothetical protein ABSF77_06450 [Spirochaetia bacterium]|jgi:hypothetical protein